MTTDPVVAGCYFVASLCVVYKLAFLVRQIAPLHSAAVLVFRLLAVFAGTIIIYRMVQVAQGVKQAEWFDVLTQIGWCFLLYFTIVILGRRKRVW